MRRYLRTLTASLTMLTLVVCAHVATVHAQGRVLGREDIRLYGFGLRVEPDHQVVPKDIATIVSTFLASGNTPPGDLPPFAPDAVVKGVLFGPGYPNGLELTSKPNTPFNIPPIGVPGVYTFENIRLESGGEILMRGIPESTTIEVIEKLLVTQVTARALTAQEVREKGIVFDRSNFQAYNFTAAFALQDTPVRITFPVVLPTLQGAQNASVNTVDLASVPGATLPQLKTIIPDTLKLQTLIPNLQVVGFTLTVPNLQGNQLIVPPIPGVVVIPGDIGFLDQFFSVMLLVGNVAPEGSNLVVSDLRGEILLPAGNDGVTNSSDDPLRMANTTGGESPRVRLVVQPGLDGKAGTADDIPTLGPGESGNAEYLVEGKREGSWNIEFNITGTLAGLPVGPVTVTGRAAGAVLVRNPNFTLTFTHPSTVSAGEKYSLDVTVTNTSTSPANLVSVNLFSQNISGAGLIGDPVRTIDSIPPGDSATVSFDLVARVTGKVTAATLDSDEKVQGRFALKAAVGELGVPVSPDSLVLPSEANGLPADLRNAVLGMLGKAWAVATAPSAALPKDVQRFSKQIVYDRAIQAAEAGFRISLHEPVPDSAAQLEMDFAGSDFQRLAALHPDPSDLPFTQADFNGFDALRRRSIRGDVLANAVAALLAPEVASNGAAAFHQSFAEKTAYRPAQLSVVVSRNGAPLPFDVSLVDAQGRRLGGVDATGKVIKEIPYGDALSFRDGSGSTTGQMLLLAAPDAGQYHLHFAPRDGVADGPFTVSIVVPGAAGLRQIVYSNVTGNSAPVSPFTSADAFSVVLDLPVAGGAGASVSASLDQPIVAPLPHLVGVVQQADKDLDQSADEVGNTRDHELGRIIAVLFDQEVTPETAQDRQPRGTITNYDVDGNSVVGVALQPGRRIAFLALRDPIGPFVPRQLTLTGVADGRGRVMAGATLPIETTVTRQAAVVTGQVIDADGTPVPSANVRLLITTKGGFLGLSSKSADADGRFSWDWVPSSPDNRIVAVNPATDDQRTVDFTVQRNGQRLNVNVVFLGRGTLTGRTLSESGIPLAHTDVVVTSLTDQSRYGVKSDDQGRFTMQRVPVGNILIEAVNVAAHSKGTASEFIPLAGGTVTRDVRMFDVTAPTIVVKLGTLTGHVLRGDGASPVGDVPVIAYYQANTQTGVSCPNPQDSECAVAAVRTDATGHFVMENITAGQLRLVSFEQSSFQQGEARVNLPANGASDVNVLYSQGLGTVSGLVVDANGQPVAGARVGGGLSLTTSDGTGHFTLTDLPVGHREIVAVSDLLVTRGTASVDLLQPGQTVNITVVLAGTASIAGTVYRPDGSTPVPNNKVFLFYRLPDKVVIVASTVTDGAGHYAIQHVPLKNDSGGDAYELSSFKPDFTDGNVKVVALKFNNQVFRGDIVFRGGGGRVNGHVYAADGVTPLRAAVGISGDQVAIAGGLVGIGFQHVTYYRVADADLLTGAFTFSNVFVGPFTLSAAGQFSPDPINFDSRILSAGDTVEVDLRLQATSKVQGTVFLPDGVTPVGSNVIVRFQSSAVKVVCATTGNVTVGDQTVGAGECAEIPQGIQDESAVTDAGGRFEVPLVNAGAFTLTAEDPATGKTGQVLGTIRPGQTGDFSIRLLGTSSLQVRVFGSNATTPIPGARVEVKQVGFPNKSVTTLADAQGTVLLNGGDAFTEGDVVVNATDVRNGFAGRAAGKVTTDGGTLTLNVYLFDAVGTVSGVVYKSDGLTPVPNAEVVIAKCDVGPAGECVPAGPLAFDVTDANGAYRQENIPLGAFRVDVFEAATARLGFGSGRIDLAGQEVPLDIREAGRGLVTGTALAGGTLSPLTNWVVSLFQIMPGGRQIELRAASDIDGTFAFPGVTVGDFRLLVSKYQDLLQPDMPYGAAEAHSRVLTEGQHVDVPVLVQLNQRVYGRVEGVVFSANGTPAANVSVALCPICQADLSLPSAQLFAVTGADGSFAFDHVRIGRFTVLAKEQTSLNAASGAGELLFDGDAARLTLTLTGLGRISGTVEFADGRPVQTAQLTLHGQPSSGCDGGACTAFTDSAGRFTFIDIPARTFWIGAADVVSGLSGTVSGLLAPGDPLTVRIVLQPTGAVSGRVLFEAGAPAPGITAELAGTGALSSLHLFQVSDPNGLFAFPVVPIGSYVLGIQDPVGPGIAQRNVQVSGAVALGDVRLDETRPSISSTIPAASASGVPLNSTIRLVFSERVSTGTITQANIVVAGPAGPVLGTLTPTDGDTAALFTPLSPLLEKTRYTISVQNVTDLVGKVMAPYGASLVTIDLTPPAITELTPPLNGQGIALATTVRVKFSEPIDPTRYRGPPITLLRGAATVNGRTDFILGNTAVVFTPTLPLEVNTLYAVQVAAATDLSGNIQAQSLAFDFRTFDQTPPQVTGLTAAGNGSVIENQTTQIVAAVDALHDISVVDFYVNDQPVFAARTTPFTLVLQAVASVGRPGDQIKISAFATDTSGNRSTSPAVLLVPIVADAPPAVTITAPANGTAFRTGDRVTVTVHGTDDLGVNQVGYRAVTGSPQDAATVTLTPVAVDATRSFAFIVPPDAAPGSSIVINASATDAKGQPATALPITITVLDATLPTVTITGTTTGARVAPGQETTAIVLAEDLGGIAAVSLTTGGVAVGTQSHPVSPVQNSAAVSFTFTIPDTARPGDTLILDATAVDAAGNVGSAARLLLPVADLSAPTLHLRTSSGGLELVPGTTTTVIVEAVDDTAVASASLQGQGAFSFNTARQVSPPSNSAQVSFAIQVPADAPDGAALNLAARATDVFGNVSVAVPLTLTVRSSQSVALPPSAIVAAGATTTIEVQLGTPAGPDGLRVDLQTDTASIARVDQSVQFNSGETSKSATLTGVTGGITTLTALINNVPRATMTITVRGGMVTGVVLNDQLQPVAGANVAVSSNGGFGIQNAVTDGAGAFSVEGVGGGYYASFTVKAFDPATQFIGYASGSLNVPNGFGHVTVVLVSAGSIGGSVVLADGATPVPAGARVDLFAASQPSTPLGTTFTDDAGSYEFPVVSLGSYFVEASDIHGNRGRSAVATLSATGQHVDVDISYLGRGSVTGIVRDGSGNAVPNIPVSLTSTNLFGYIPAVQINAQPDGTFRFDNVFVGSFTVQARDPISNLAGTAGGAIQQDGQVASADIVLAPWATVQGTVFRPDGVTPVAGARVDLSAVGAAFTTTTDVDGHYVLPFVPLGFFSLQATEIATSGFARTSGTLSVNGQVVTRDLVFLPQGTLVVTVRDGAGNAVSGAAITVTQANFSFALYGTSDATGVALIEHVLASDSVRITATAGGLYGVVTTTLAANELKSVTVSLMPTASIAGTVYLPDGASPAAAATVTACGFGCVTMPVNADGTYRFDGLALYSWSLSVMDAVHQKRAVARDVILGSAGQVATVNLTMIGIGSVTGRVLNPDSSSASDMAVTVHSLDPDLGGFAQVRTDAAGFYRADRIVAGGVVVNAGDPTRGLLGETQGTLAHDGDTLTLDILLKNNAITLPVTKADANAFTFDLQRDGSIGYGYRGVFGYDCCPVTNGAMYLDVVSGGTPRRFTGATIGTTEDFGRQVVVSQNGLAGLNVTRKILVSNAYFARYLELLTNPTTGPITVDVRLQGKVKAANLFATSSGDDLLDVSAAATADRWAMFNAPDYDPFLTDSFPQAGFVFDGIGARARASIGTIDSSTAGRALFAFGWTNVTIQPGQTVAFMHFAVQQYSRASAQASLERLAQLPPEALESLSPIEIAAIQNFAVPADGTSPVAPLPPLGGAITGRVLEADSTTPVVFPRVRLRSHNLFFGRVYQTNADASGSFSFAGANVTVPIDGFALEADHPLTRVVSPSVEGAFTPGLTTANVNIVFSNTGIIRGSVRRTSGQLVAGAAITATSPLNLSAVFAASGTDGSYVASGIPAGAATIIASIQHPQGAYGSTLIGTGTVTVTAGQVQSRDVIIEPTGTVTGTVRTALGAAAPNVLVQANGCRTIGCFALQTHTDSSGVYRFVDVPIATVTVRAYDPNSNFPSAGDVVVAQDQTSTLNLTFVGTGSIAVVVKFANQAAAASAYVEVVRPLGSSGNYSDVNGRVTVTSVLPGPFVLRVHHPRNFSASVDITGSISSTGQTVNVNAVVPPVGTLVVQVTSGGAPVVSVPVNTDAVTQGSLQAAGYTSGTGQMTQLNVPGGRPIQIVATDSNGQRATNASALITAEGQVVTVAMAVDAAGTITGRVLRGTAPMQGMFVTLVGAAANSNRSTQTGQDGTYVFGGVPLGAFRVTVGGSAGSGATNGLLANNGGVVTADVLLNATGLAATLADANAFSYRIGGGGYLSGGAYSSFPSLSVGTAGNFGNFFSGDTIAASELNGRQLVIANTVSGGALPYPMAGINVTRKVYVDPSGYFTRILDVLENPGTSLAVMDVGLRGSMAANGVVATSSGAATPGAGDQWLVTNSGGSPASNAAFVVAGANPLVPLVLFQASFGSLSVGWNSVVVPAGGRAALMHFETQAPNQASAIAMAQRLVQLPPEALTGLTPEERSTIQNFVVPADGSSPLAPFGAISGRVVGGDGVTPASNVRVLVTGNVAPYFNQTATVLTDADGRYVARTLAAGPVTVQAFDPATQALTAIVSATSDGQTPIARDLMFTATGVLTGSVIRTNGLPVPGATVTAYNQTFSVFQTIFTGADGRYRFASMPAGIYTVQASLNDGRNMTAAGNVVSVGNVTNIDVRLPAAAGIRVTVTLGGAPLAGARVTRNGLYAGDTGAAGTLLIPSVLAGPFTIQISSSGSSSSSITLNGVIRNEDDGNIIDVSAQVFLGSLSGTVRAADGTTPIPFTNLEVFDQASGARIGTASTDGAGRYQLPGLLATGPFRVVAHGPSFAFSVTVEALRSFDVSTTLVIDFQLPIATVRGTVFQADRATVVPFAQLGFAQEASDGGTNKQTVSADGNGRFSFFAVAGIFDLEARDSLYWYATRASGTVIDLATAQTVDLALPALGVVRGIVRDGNGQPMPGVTVTIQATRTDLDGGTGISADSSGAYQFDRVPVGGFALQACTYTGSWVCGNGSGVVAGAGLTATVDMTVPATGTLSGTVFSSNGTTPMPNAHLSITPVFDGHSFNSNLRRDVTADATGHYTADNIQAGPVTVTLTDFYTPGLATGTVTAGASTTVDVTLGSAARCNVTLYDAATFVTNATCTGALSVGGTYDGHLSDAYTTGYALRINGQAANEALAARTELGGRQIVYGPVGLGSVITTRKLFVPATGQFARYLDTVTNPTNAPVTIDVQIDSALSGAVHLVVDPVSTGTYALTQADPSRNPNYGFIVTRPLLGHVFGALGAPVQVNTTFFQQLLGSSYYRWTVTLAPGQSMTFMHFAFGREPGDSAGADAQAHALVDLTDPNALFGMTPAEKALVVNFVVQ